MEKEQIALVRDIMTEDIITATPKTPLVEIIRLITEKGLNGVPIKDDDGKLLGLVTEYDLINHEILAGLPTPHNIANDTSSNEPEEIKNNIARIKVLTAGDIMNPDPLTLFFTDSYEQALAMFNEHHRVNPVPVIDKDRKVVGIVSRYDLIKLLKLYGHT